MPQWFWTCFVRRSGGAGSASACQTRCLPRREQENLVGRAISGLTHLEDAAGEALLELMSLESTVLGGRQYVAQQN